MSIQSLKVIKIALEVQLERLRHEYMSADEKTSETQKYRQALAEVNTELASKGELNL